MQKSEAYIKYLDCIKTGEFSYFDENEIEDIVLDFLEDFQPDEAEKALDLGVKLHPDSEQLQKLQVLVAIDHGELNLAEKLLHPFLNDGTIATLDLQFNLALRRKEYSKACSFYVEGVKKGILSIEEACNAYENSWNELPKEELREALIPLSDIAQDDAFGLCCISHLLVNMKEFTPAIKLLNRSLDLDAYNLDSWRYLMGCYFDTLQYDKCIETCDYALAIEDDNIIMHFVRGFIYTHYGEYDKAIPDLKFVIDYRENNHPTKPVKPDVPIEEQKEQLITAYELILECYRKTQNIKNSHFVLEKLLQLRPNDPKVLFDMTLQLISEDNFTKALTSIESAIALDPDNNKYKSLQISILTSLGEYEESLKILDEVLKKNPQSKSALLAKGELCLHLGLWEEADKVYKTLLIINPKDAQSQKLIARYFARIGDWDTLDKYFSKKGNTKTKPQKQSRKQGSNIKSEKPISEAKGKSSKKKKSDDNNKTI